jgi:exonuclease III
MPEITDPLPPAVQDDLDRLKAALDLAVPARAPGNLLVGTWNIRAFGGLAKKWESVKGDSPRRDFHAAVCIAEILSRFDVIAVQEVKGDLRALRHTLKRLGPQWSFVLTDVTRGGQGNDERLAFLFDTARVKMSGLACELVVPDDLKTPYSSAANAFQRQFARTPYAVSFLSGDQTFVLVTLHVIYGKKSADRTQELTAIAKWLRAWAEEEDDFGHNLICMGDFNVDRKDDPLYQAFTSTGLAPAPDLVNLPRTIFSKVGPDGPDTFYDQIAWFQTVKNKPYLTLKYRKAGNFDFTGKVLKDLTLQELSWRMSDHFPMWVEFGL